MNENKVKKEFEDRMNSSEPEKPKVVKKGEENDQSNKEEDTGKE